MGTASPPPTPSRPGARPAPAPASGPPQAAGAPGPTSRYGLSERTVSMGPSGTAILLTIAAIAVGVWLWLRPPTSIGEQALQKYTGYETNIETVFMRSCSPPGCAGVYLTPVAGRPSTDALPGAIALSTALADQGIEFFIIFGGEPVPELVKRARGIRRPVVFDPNGEWAKDSGIEKAPTWIAWRTGGKVRLRAEEPPTAADLVAAIR